MICKCETKWQPNGPSGEFLFTETRVYRRQPYWFKTCLEDGNAATGVS